MTALDEIEGHRVAHDPQTDKTDLHYPSSRAGVAATVLHTGVEAQYGSGDWMVLVGRGAAGVRRSGGGADRARAGWPAERAMARADLLGALYQPGPNLSALHARLPAAWRGSGPGRRGRARHATEHRGARNDDTALL